jgi:thioredoxin-related protein
MKKYIIFILMIFPIFNNSCTTRAVDKTDICYLEEKSDIMLSSDIVNSVTFIPLETNDNFIIGSIDKILKIDGLYYFLDRKTKTIFIYDETGKSIKKIAHIGYGPGEYVSINDFIVTAIKLSCCVCPVN